MAKKITKLSKSKKTIKKSPSSRKLSKHKKQSIIAKEVEEIEQWIHERRKFLKKLLWILVIITAAIIITKLI